MASIQIIFGAHQIDRVVTEADKLLQQYRNDIGFNYYEYHSVIPSNTLLPEDLAVTLLVNSQVGWRAFNSLKQFGDTINLSNLPSAPLECTTAQERKRAAEVVATMAGWPGFAASVATKVLHKKRPELIPILDNQAIFGAYMNSSWPAKNASQDSIKIYSRIVEALNWIYCDLTRAENVAGWQKLRQQEPSRTLIQIFDSVWWMYFRTVQPVKQNSSVESRE